MKSLRAFVGHSFTAEDEEVVGKILRHLDVIGEVNTEFTWEHAEPAEPAAIDDKVLRLFADKNVFIGICTRKERVIHPSKLSEGGVLQKNLRAKPEDFAWKTSDWVIQEIGYALGRGMKVILLVEEGVRAPGGIQGTLEYISFERNAPEKAFGKLLQMIGKLAPAGRQEGVVDPAAEKEAEPAECTESVDDYWLSPDHTWDRWRYEFGYSHALIVGREDDAERIHQAFLDSPVGSGHQDKEWVAFREFRKVRSGGEIKRLQALALENPNDPGVLKYLGRAYKALGEDLKAAEVFSSASAVETKLEGKIRLLGDVIECAMSSKPSLAEASLNRAKEIARVNPAMAPAVLALENSFSKERKEDGFMFASMERLLEDVPDDHSKRFDLAFAYGEAGQTDMATYHYRRIPDSARSDATWNNLGVAYAGQKLHARSIAAYRKSKDLGGTLAMSNLAYRLIEVGFLEEARAICEEAILLPDHHKNVDTAFAKVKETEDSEAESEGKLVRSAQSTSDFYRGVGSALLDSPISDFEEDWVFDGVRVRAVLLGASLSFVGTGESNVTGIMRALGGTKPDTFEVSFSGAVRGRAVQGSYEKKSRGISAFGRENERESVMMYFSSDESSIEILIGRGEKQRSVKVLRPAMSAAPAQATVEEPAERASSGLQGQTA